MVAVNKLIRIIPKKMRVRDRDIELFDDPRMTSMFIDKSTWIGHKLETLLNSVLSLWHDKSIIDIHYGIRIHTTFETWRS
jgi:hypothetical protein